MQSNRASKKTKIAEEKMAPASEMNASAEGLSKPRTSRSSKLKKEGSETGPAKHRKTSVTETVVPTPVVAAPIIDPVGVVTPVAEMTVVAAAAASAKIQPTHEEIAKLAHSYWVSRGYTHGSMEQDWLRAERELSAKH